MKNKLFAVYACYGIDADTTRVLMPVGDFMTAIKLAYDIPNKKGINFALNEQYIGVAEIKRNEVYEDFGLDYWSFLKLPYAVFVRIRRGGAWEDEWKNEEYKKVWEEEQVRIDDATARKNSTFVKVRESEKVFASTTLTPFDYEHVYLMEANYKDGLDLMKAYDGDYLHPDDDAIFLGKWGGNKL